MTATASMMARARIAIRAWVRNGKAPTAELENRLAETLIHACAARGGAQKFHFWTPIGSIPASDGTRDRRHLALHTSPFHVCLVVWMELAPQSAGPTDPSGLLEVFAPSAPSTPVGVARVNFGASDGTFPDVPSTMGGGWRFVVDPADSAAIAELDADTEYVAKFSDVDGARLVSATIWEITEEDLDGPRPNHGAGGPIFDLDRDRTMPMARALHGRTAIPLWHGGAELDDDAATHAFEGLGGQLAENIGDITSSATAQLSISGTLDKTIGDVTLQATGGAPDIDGSIGFSSDPDPAVAGDDVSILPTIEAQGSDAATLSMTIRIGMFDGLGTGRPVSLPSVVDADGWAFGSWTIATDYFEVTAAKGSVVLGSPSTPELEIHLNPGHDVAVRVTVSALSGGVFVTTRVLDVTPA